MKDSGDGTPASPPKIKSPDLAGKLNSVFEALVKRGKQTSDNEWQARWRNAVNIKRSRFSKLLADKKRATGIEDISSKVIKHWVLLLYLEKGSTSNNYGRYLNGELLLTFAQISDANEALVLLGFAKTEELFEVDKDHHETWGHVFEAALPRIRAEIERHDSELAGRLANDRASAEDLATSAKILRPIFGDVPNPVGDFVGRDNELRRIYAVLLGDAGLTCRWVALHGTPGMGKTSLALKYAHDFSSSFKGVWWCRAETRTALCGSLAALGARLGFVGPHLDTVEAAKATLSRLPNSDPPWLLIYDNAGSPDELAGLLPDRMTRVIFTSRFPFWRELAEEIRIDVLPPEESILLLNTKAVRQDAGGAADLATVLDNLPLALDHAACFCRQSGLSFIEYGERVSALINLQPQGTMYPRSVAATFEIAISEVAKKCTDAEDFMSVLSYCAPDLIPRVLVDDVFDDEIERAKTVAALVNVSLIRHECLADGSPALAVHRLVQAVGVSRARRRDRAIEFLLLNIGDLFQGVSSESTISMRTDLRDSLVPHGLIEWSLEFPEPMVKKVKAGRCDNLLLIGDYLWRTGRYWAAEDPLREGYHLMVELCGEDDERTVITLSSISQFYSDWGDLRLALHLCKKVMKIFERTGVTSGRRAGLAHERLGNAYKSVAEYSAAKPMIEKAVELYEQALGVDASLTIQSKFSLAYLLIDTDDADAGLSIVDDVLRRARSTQPFKEHLNEALHARGLALIALQRWDEAQQDLTESLTLHVREVGRLHPYLISTIMSLAYIATIKKNFWAAWKFHAHAYRIRLQAFGLSSPEIPLSLNAIAILLCDTSRQRHAWRFFFKAIEVASTIGDRESEAIVRADFSFRLFSMGFVRGAFFNARLAFKRLKKSSKETGRKADVMLTIYRSLVRMGFEERAERFLKQYETTEEELERIP